MRQTSVRKFVLAVALALATLTSLAGCVVYDSGYYGGGYYYGRGYYYRPYYYRPYYYPYYGYRRGRWDD